MVEPQRYAWGWLSVARWSALTYKMKLKYFVNKREAFKKLKKIKSKGVKVK